MSHKARGKLADNKRIYVLKEDKDHLISKHRLYLQEIRSSRKVPHKSKEIT